MKLYIRRIKTYEVLAQDGCVLITFPRRKDAKSYIKQVAAVNR